MRFDIRRIASRAAALALATSTTTRTIGAQRPEPVGARPVATTPTAAGLEPQQAPRSPLVVLGGQAPRAVAWAPAASLLVPGAGQAMLHQTRGVAYIAAEVYVLLQYREFARDARARRMEYRRTAREVARRQFGGVRDGPWSYYEDVQDFIASGEYNLTPGGPFTPETDPSTFNGRRWLDARALYWLDPDVAPPRTDPRYVRALENYMARAVQGEFRWSWRGEQLQRQLYLDAITRENQLTRYMNTTLNVLLVNHLISAIDALTSVRLRQSSGPSGERRYEATIPWAPFGRAAPRQP